MPSVVFHIKSQECFTSVNLLGKDGRVFFPLLARNLNSGHYKLTVDPYFLHIDSTGRENLTIKVAYCNQSITLPLSTSYNTKIDNRE